MKREWLQHDVSLGRRFRMTSSFGLLLCFGPYLRLSRVCLSMIIQESMSMMSDNFTKILSDFNLIYFISFGIGMVHGNDMEKVSQITLSAERSWCSLQPGHDNKTFLDAFQNRCIFHLLSSSSSIRPLILVDLFDEAHQGEINLKVRDEGGDGVKEDWEEARKYDLIAWISPSSLVWMLIHSICLYYIFSVFSILSMGDKSPKEPS